MKYQQLKNLESGWKWLYLTRKHREGEKITRYVDRNAADTAVADLIAIKNDPVSVLSWIDQHMTPDLDNKLKQTIRARRKRYFNAQQQHLRKKSVDLEFLVWQRLSRLAKWRHTTLSETVVQLLEDAEKKEKYANKMSSLKQDIQSLLALSDDIRTE